MSQINFASRFMHPNLKAIAPWEGITNVYDHQVCRGGILDTTGFNELVVRGFAGTSDSEGWNRNHSTKMNRFWKSGERWGHEPSSPPF